MKLVSKCLGSRFRIAGGLLVITLAMVSAERHGNMANQERQSEVVAQKVDGLFADFLAEKFQDLAGIVPESGWLMTLASGRKVPRSFLQRQASTVVALGQDAVPHLFKWVMHDDLAIRYIAIYSLEEITGLKPYIPYFDVEDRHGYRERATRVWEEWWNDR